MALCLGTLCFSQQNTETGPQGDTFKFETKLNVVLVPVLVRDAQGNMVGTLKKEDFHLPTLEALIRRRPKMALECDERTQPYCSSFYGKLRFCSSAENKQ